MQKTQVQSLGRDDPLEEEMATHSSILAQEIWWTEEPAGPHSPRGQKESDMTEWQSRWAHINSSKSMAKRKTWV